MLEPGSGSGELARGCRRAWVALASNLPLLGLCLCVELAPAPSASPPPSSSEWTAVLTPGLSLSRPSGRTGTAVVCPRLWPHGLPLEVGSVTWTRAPPDSFLPLGPSAARSLLVAGWGLGPFAEHQGRDRPGSSCGCCSPLRPRPLLSLLAGSTAYLVLCLALWSRRQASWRPLLHLPCPPRRPLLLAMLIPLAAWAGLLPSVLPTRSAVPRFPAGSSGAFQVWGPVAGSCPVLLAGVPRWVSPVARPGRLLTGWFWGSPLGL